MRRSVSIHAKSCCADEKARLMDILFTCDYCTDSLEARHRCYQKAAKQSGSRARQCLMTAT
jgi:hypothetical protein